MLKHILIIGGTGMLKGVVLKQFDDFDIVSVLSRNEENFQKLKQDAGKHGSKLNWINCDYGNYQELGSQLIKAIGELNEISRVVSWVHSTAPLAPVIAAKIINHQRTKCNYFDIINSDGESRETSFAPFENITYHAIKLGYVKEGDANRWLNDAEISEGVLNAVKSGEKEFIIGTI